MLEFIFRTALVLFGLPDAGRIFADGFEELTAVYISTDRPENIVWSIDSTNHNAAFVTSRNFLTDGKVAVPTRMTWDVGAQTNTSFIKLTAPVSGLTITVTPGTAVFALLCPNTPFALPVGAYVYMELRDTVSGDAAIVNGLVVQFNNGGRGFISTATNPTSSLPFTPNTVEVDVYNRLSVTVAGPTWATSGQTFDIGEIWFGNLEQFQLANDPKSALVDPTLMRRSHNNNPWPLFIKPYKQWTFNFTPMTDMKAYDNTSAPSFDSIRYSLAIANCALVLPRIYNRGTSVQNPVDLNQLACFGKPDSVGQISGVSNGAYWTASMVFGEAPP